ncbi:hypothetical protein BU23DRAFT_524936 [Bimuria novae-zelandiae CBS 107.79]|uniref:RING-CH-type domain-containing protein n=1 Tax=Bimuria novae-zelandiae CBS 107.79 TaxID=1447943 RepID=A0A6A5VP76_9PLEO|nr:hypothetical protein BU23DRAFT_524936 [Bimuria novae-zelandiae CBS 107.79]
MATLPRHPPSWSQRRASPPAESASPEQSHPPRTNSISATSVDSHTVLLNSSPIESAQPAEAAQQEAPTQTEPHPTQSDDEPRRCWICFNDETDDDETTSEWRSPCPCVLVAHEKCLLDWVADMEAPNAGRRAGRSAGKILCPQCKSEIRLQRPRDVVVETVRSVEKLTKYMVLPGIFSALGVATYTTLHWLGQDTIYKIFDYQDAYNILRPLYSVSRRADSHHMYMLYRFRDHWQLDLGLPAIPLVIILSRTRMADSFLPFLPLVFLAGGGGGAQPLGVPQFSWPPSAAFTVAALPYIRSIYNSYYDHFWLRHERRWLKEVQPRAEVVEEVDGDVEGGDDAEAILNALAEEGDGEDDGDEVVVDVDVDLLFDWHAGAAPAPDVPQQHEQPRRARIRRERNAALTTGGISDTILGALIFPTIAAAMGEALKVVLPTSWVTPTAGQPQGFLQNKWARSIVGGCLFVGLKDAVLLYVRWKMAQTHHQRRVLDYEGSKGKKKSAT